ncbi:hypothetical protein AUEXF2481DRAFT_54524, partial [Aureobasidium subglaciale EXF-2481]
GPNALNQAAADGDEEEVRRLLEQGASVEGILDDRQTPLQFAAQEGHTRIVQLLIEYGADINALGYNGSALETPLQAAAVSDRIAIARLLLDRGA